MSGEAPKISFGIAAGIGVAQGTVGGQFWVSYGPAALFASYRWLLLDDAPWAMGAFGGGVRYQVLQLHPALGLMLAVQVLRIFDTGPNMVALDVEDRWSDRSTVSSATIGARWSAKPLYLEVGAGPALASISEWRLEWSDRSRSPVAVHSLVFEIFPDINVALGVAF